MIIDGPRSFWSWMDRLEKKIAAGDGRSQQIRTYALAELTRLRDLDAEPVEESATFKRVRQSGQYPLWRVSHPFVDGIAVRTIIWFPPAGGQIVVVALAADKGPIGDVFYSSVGSRADAAINQYLYERKGESDE